MRSQILKYWCILYIEPYSLELSRSTCSCQHGPSLHSGIRQSLHPYVVLGDLWGLLNSLLSRDLFVVFTESSQRGFLLKSCRGSLLSTSEGRFGLLSLGPSIYVQRLSIRTSQSIVLNLTPVLGGAGLWFCGNLICAPSFRS
jgi:hypothetical protein